MTTPRHRPTPPDRRASEDGQILVLTVVVALALLAILGLVADGGLILARHRELQGIADAAARAGAAQLDEASYRASNGRTATLNPAQAQAAAGRYLRTKSRSNYLRWFVL
jgi:Flp pilus assembly protein TadG